MKFKSLSFMTCLFAVMFVLLSSTIARAAEPFGVLSLGSYKSLEKTTIQIGDMLDNPQMGMMFQALDGVFGPEFLEGFDKSKPMGAALYADSKDKTKVFPLIFIPQKDSGALVNRIAEYQEGLEINEEFKEGDLTLIQMNFESMSLFVRDFNGWTFLSTESKALVNLPKNPEKLLGDMGEKYTLGLKLDLDKMPKEIKEFLLDQFKQGMDVAQAVQKMKAEDLEDSDDSDDSDQSPLEKLQALSANQQMSFEEIKTLVEESKVLVIGIGADKNNIFVQTYYESIPDSEMGKTMTALADAKPYVNCLLPEASLTAASVTRNLPSAIEKSKKQISELKDLIFESLEEEGVTDKMDSEKLQKAKKLADKSEELIIKLLDQSGKQNVKGGIAFFFQPDKVSIVSANPDCNVYEMDKLIKEWVNLAVSEDDAKDVINWDAETWEGLKFSTFTFSVEKIKNWLKENAEEKAEQMGKQLDKMFGKTIVLAYAHSDKDFYFAAGKDSVELIKTVVKNDKAQIPAGIQSYVTISLGQILETIAQFQAIDESIRDQFSMVATSAKGDDNEDKIIFKASYGKNSTTGTMEMQKGIVRALNALMMIYAMNNM